MAVDLDRTATRAAPVICGDNPLVSDLMDRMCKSLNIGEHTTNTCGFIDTKTKLLVPYSAKMEITPLSKTKVHLSSGKTVSIECPLMVFTTNRETFQPYERLSEDEFYTKFLMKTPHIPTIDSEGKDSPPNLSFFDPPVPTEQPLPPPPVQYSFF
jgi:hypothetical protein